MASTSTPWCSPGRLPEPPSPADAWLRLLMTTSPSSLSRQAVSVAGYMAFGSSIQPDILTRFAGPDWVLIWANAMVIIHMVPAYQVYAQPTLAFIEERYARWAKAPAWSTVSGGGAGGSDLGEGGWKRGSEGPGRSGKV